MPTVFEIWNGDDWEVHVLRLLHDRHGPTNVQKVPARHKGDCGIDAYCLSERAVYQCYAVEEPCTVASRAEKQRDKITTDINKLIDPAKGAATLFKGHPIKRWILVAPLHDSQDVNRHAIRKQAEVRALGFAHIDPNFEILIHDRDDFDEESYARRAQQRAKIKAMARAASDADVVALQAGSSDLIANLRRKLAKRLRPDEPLEDAADLAMREYITTQNALDDLRVLAPEPYETIVALTNQRLRRLRMVGSRSGQTPGETLEAEIELFIAGLRERLPTLDPETVEQLAMGTISEWLMLCPLDFH
jgi:hypothetical protein